MTVRPYQPPDRRSRGGPRQALTTRAPWLAPLLASGRTLATLALMSVPLPANLALTAAALITATRGRPPRATGPAARTVLINGGKMTKALTLARAFSRAGHRVVLVESGRYRHTGHRYSRAVDRFYTVPDPGAPDYAQALQRIVDREKVDFSLPVSSPVGSRYDAGAKKVLEPACEVFSLDSDLVDILDDKHRFAELALSLGLPVARSYRMTCAEQIHDIDLTTSTHGYLLKSISYDPAGRLQMLRLTGRDPDRETALVARLSISEQQPWVLQEFFAGQEFCTHSTVRNGHVQVYACSRSSAAQLNHAMADVPEIEQWVRRFAARLQLSGQIAFDFIRTPDGRVLPAARGVPR